MRSLPRTRKLSIALLTLAASAPFSFAQTYVGKAYEPFDYTAGASITTAQAGGFGFNPTGDFSVANTTTWQTGPAASGTRTIASSTLDYLLGSYPTELGLAATVTGAGTSGTNGTSGAIGRSLGQTVSSGTFYFSYLTAKTVDNVRSLNFAFFNGTNERVAIGQIGNNLTLVNGDGTPDTTTTPNSGNFSVLVSNIQNATGAGGVYSSSTPIAYGLNTTHLIVGKIEFDYAAGFADRLTLYVDPTNLSNEGSLSPYLVVSNNDFGALNGFRIFAGGSSTSANAPASTAGIFDEVRFGTTFADVVTTTAIPEPSTWALIVGAAGLGFAAMRRRRA